MYFSLKLWAFTRGVRLRIAFTVLAGLLAAAVGVGRLAGLGWLLGRIFSGAPLAELLLPALLVTALMVLRGVLEHFRTLIAHHTAARVQMHIRQVLYRQVVALGPAYFEGERSGEVILSLVEGVEQLETYFGQYLPQLFVCALTPLAIFAGVALLDLPVAGVMLLAALATLLLPQLFHKLDEANSLRRQQAYGAFGAEFLDAVQGLGTLKAFGQSEARGWMLARKAHAVFESTMWVLSTNAIARGVTDAGIAVGLAAAVILGVERVSAGEMTLEALLVVLMMGSETFRPLRELRTLLHNGMLGLSAATGIFKILSARPHVRERQQEPPAAAESHGTVSHGTVSHDTVTPAVVFEDVVFAYPGGRQAAHRGLNFTVAEGERVGIVGASGAGKSSIVRLLLRLYDPGAGRVLLEGKDVRKWGFAELRGRLAIVHQDTFLFHGTVEENLRLGKPDATPAELESAARSANAHRFISALPQGYATVIGERGLRLSGGQRQRIAIARALLRDAPVLVLDEALSSVDAENETVIQEALERLMKGRTTLIFAHRLSSVIGADRLLVLRDGKVVESGSHAVLMGTKGEYHRLMADQAQEAALAEAVAQPEQEPAAPAPADAEQEHLSDAILKAEGMGWPGVVRVLLGMVAPWKWRLILTVALGVARVAAFIGVGVFSALMVAALKTDAPYAAWGLALLIIAPAAGLLHWLESWLAHDMAFRLLSRLRIALFEKLEKLAPAYLLRRRTGDLAAMATQDVEMVEYFFAHTVAPAFVALLVPTVVLGVLAAFDWAIAAALFPFLLLVALSPLLLRGRIDALGARTREALGELNAHALDTIQGLSEVLAFQQEQAREAVFMARNRAYQRIRLSFYRELTFQTALLETCTGLGGLAVVLSGAVVLGADGAGSAYLPLLSLCAMAAFLPVAEIAHIGHQLADTLGATRRLYAVHGEEVPIVDGAGVPERAAAGGLSLQLTQLRFCYPGTTRPALDGVSLHMPAGRTLALVGSSGAGKTTVANLLLRFWDPQEGTVCMDGVDLRHFRLDALRRKIALVSQDVYLFNDTLAANILLARPDASLEQLNAAISRAALAEFVAGLPQGLQTGVGERGMQLSGGQRQRVAIARAFLKDAPLLILDEATSHLDALSEQAVRGALEQLMQNRTTVVIAHRLSTVRNAHRIAVLDEGRMVEEGTHQELLARRGLYARLVSRQLARVS